MRLLILIVIVLLMQSCMTQPTRRGKKTIDYSALCYKHGMFDAYRWEGRVFKYKCTDGYTGKINQ